VIERLRYFNFIYRGATFRATLGLGFPEERLYVMEQDCTFGAADRDNTLGGAGRKRHCPGSDSPEALYRSRNNETPASRTLLGGRGRFQGGDTAASNDYTAGAPAGRSGMREFIALDTAEAATDPADSPAGTAGDRRRNGGHSGGGHGGGGHGGPCGEMSVGHKPNPQHREDETPSNETAKPN